MDRSIDVGRWITVAEEAVCDVNGALSVLGVEQPDNSLELYNLSGLDPADVAEYLRDLVTKLQVMATNLIYFAENADLTELAESLKPSSNGTTGEGA